MSALRENAMKPMLVPATEAMFAAVYEGVLRELNPRIPAEAWQRIFRFPWRTIEDYVGYALLDQGGAVVGFAGYIYSQQSFGGSTQTVCNVSSWVVKNDYRSYALPLLGPVLKRRDVTITNLTGIPAVGEMFLRLGFDVLETHTRVFPLFRLPHAARYRVRPAKDISGSHFPEPVRQIRSDHTGLGEHLLVDGAGGPCYLIFTRGRRWKLGTARIHYFSDVAVFARALPAIQQWLLWNRGLPLVECDNRLVSSLDIPGGIQVRLGVPRLFRSTVYRPAELTNLYSELVLLDI